VLNIAVTRKAGENVGSYDITATATSDNYDITITNSTLTITKRAVTVKVEDETVPNRGEAYAPTNFSADNLVSGHKLGTVTLDKEPVRGVGEYTFTPVAAVILDASGNQVTGNYEFTYVSGVLTIVSTSTEITLSASTVHAVRGDRFKLDVFLEPAETGLDGLTYTSSNPAVASVDKNGVILVRATRKSSATITVTLPIEGGSLSASCVIEVNAILPVITVPKALTTISAEAFDGSSIQAIDLSRNNGMTICKDAFRDCANLLRVLLPTSVAFENNANVFTFTGEGSSNAVLFCQNEAQAEYAAANNLAYVMISK